MHESSLARELLRIALERAAAERASSVVRVVAWAAETEALSQETLRLHFAAAARGTLADGAVLDVQLTHVSARCRACGAEFLPEHHLLVCSACGGLDADVLGRVGLGVDSIEVT